MARRTALVFPRLEDGGEIAHIRARFDPLANLIAPHITLLFPFESPMSDAQLQSVLRDALCEVKPFVLELRGVGRRSDAYGHWLFLRVTEGAEALRRIRRLLLDAGLPQTDANALYMPHLTLGRLPTKEQLDAAYRELAGLDLSLHTVVDTVWAERIGPDRESIRVASVGLAAVREAKNTL